MNTGVVPVPCRWGRHNTTQVCGLTPAILAIPRIKSGSKPSFLSALELSSSTLLNLLILSFLLNLCFHCLDEVLLQKVTPDGSNVGPFLVFMPKTVGEIN